MKVYMAKSDEKLWKGVAEFEKLNASELEEVTDLKARNEKKAKDTWSGKRMHGQFISDLGKEKTWARLSRCDFKVGTEVLICAAQKQSIR